MIGKVIQRIKLYRSLRFFQYLYLNHFCKNIIRTDHSHIFPYKNAVLDMAPTAKIVLGGGDIELGCDLMRGSRAETRVRLRDHAVWSSEGGCKIYYGATVELLHHAVLDSQYFTLNTGSTLVAAKRIQLGHDVMIGRGVVIYDSDHHTLQNAQGETTNPDAPVVIGDHVWLATHVTVLKGSRIGSGSMVAANAVVHGSIAPETMVQTVHETRMRENYGGWNRVHPEE